jgi:hypothetical protein
MGGNGPNKLLAAVFSLLIFLVYPEVDESPAIDPSGVGEAELEEGKLANFNSNNFIFCVN